MRPTGFSLNPLDWLGDAAGAVVADAWEAAMTALWSAALWLLGLAFRIIDAFTIPDLSASGPMGAILPTTLWVGGALAVIMMFVQLTTALARRDGQSMGKLLWGIGQFGLVWLCYLGVAGALVVAAAGLTRGILASMLNVSDLAQVPFTANFPKDIADVTLATVLGVLSLLLVIPAAFFYVVIMFVREAALIILAATAPISAAGLLAETGKAWFWKSLRWFICCLFIEPMAALLLGVGVKLSEGVITRGSGSSAGDVAAHAGMAVVGCVIIAIGAVCPLVLFRLLAFVEPSTASGAALRQSWSDTGGAAGMFGGGHGPVGAGGGTAAARLAGDGRSAGEADAESQTGGRLAAALGAVGAGVAVAAAVAHRAVDLGSDVLGQSGVGSAGYSMTPTDERTSRRSAGHVPAVPRANGDGVNGSGEGGDGATVGTAPTPAPTSLPTPGGAGVNGSAGSAGSAAAV